MTSGIALQAFLSRLEDVRRQVQDNGEDDRPGPKIWDTTASFLARIQQRLARPPRIAIVGEANTGKTSIANMLLGRELLITDIVDNTRAPILIRHADKTRLFAVDVDGTRTELSHDSIGVLRQDRFTSLELGLPLTALKSFEIIDTPGVTELADDTDRMAFVCRQADMAIWCTLATQAWRATEREFWNLVCERTRSSSLLAVTHADALSETERSRVGERLRREAGPLFSDIAMVSPVDVTPSKETAGPADLVVAFQSKLETALALVEHRRLMGARRAVQRFTQRLEDRSGVAAAEIDRATMRAAS